MKTTDDANAKRPTGLSSDDVERILRIVDESGYDEIRLEHGDLKLHIRRNATGASSPLPDPAQAFVPPPLPANAEPTASAAMSPPAPTSAPASKGGAAGKDPSLEGLIPLRAPMLGTFYRSPSPGAPPFVDEGQAVGADDTVCLIEVMKLFNSLKAGVDGTVTRILVENGAMVEFDQPLLLIDPRPRA